MTVIITIKHAQDCRFDMIQGCAMHKAIHQQHPELQVEKIFDGHMITRANERYEFSIDQNGYNRENFRALQQKHIKELRVDLIKVSRMV